MNNNIANMIDHTILKAVATKEDVKKLLMKLKNTTSFQCV
ncbi:hypothetical protein H477_1154 [[Clostridium] sordellii ATCC 9714]|nr:hypothetical protein H477_1154 [[Clostridium] sordellii ATCC 9714] [Paeniclostridium sordellii ATCC 9714]